ncbi:hypothetical protein GCM10009718_11660 [Isoptericola halotolerans]
MEPSGLPPAHTALTVRPVGNGRDHPGPPGAGTDTGRGTRESADRVMERAYGRISPAQKPLDLKS